MAVSTSQKITLISCIVLCMSLFLPKLFLPRVKKETAQSEVGPGHFPPPRHRHSFSEDHDHWDTDSHYIKHYNPEAIARAKGVGKPNLLGQFIPVYGFGIFLYIIYLFFKLTSKDKPHRQGCRFPMLQSEYTFEEMPTCQLAQMQARMSEKAREKRISKVVHPSVRSRRGTRRREERKLKQLKEITQMMRERQLREEASPEEEAEEAPYTADWEGYPEETYPEYDMTSRRRRFPSVILEEPDQVILTAEELAERMEKEEEEEEEDEPDEEVKVENDEGDKEEDDKEEEEYEEEEDEEEEEEEDEDEIREDQPCLLKSIDEDDEKLEYPGENEEEQKPSRRRQITFSDHRHVFHYPKGGAVGCKYEKEEEEEHDGEEEEEEVEDDGAGNEEEENGDEEDCEEEEEDQHNEDGQSETEKEEEDPLMEAESLGFNDEVECEPEEQEVDLIDFLQTYQPEVTIISNKSESTKAQTSGTLRMRHKKQKVKK
ncbi:protein RIC-3-like [Carassius carassius]|uniref:protein RIC-3-like n=1 Tax=Carassius carassius TaxID=217509 RepID=UPI002869257A|nr:protein RIC-3-like [Carassius carassius]